MTKPKKVCKYFISGYLLKKKEDGQLEEQQDFHIHKYLYDANYLCAFRNNPTYDLNQVLTIVNRKLIYNRSDTELAIVELNDIFEEKEQPKE